MKQKVFNRIPIKFMDSEPSLKGFASFCMSCNILYIDEISNVIYIAYRSQNSLSSADIKAIKEKISSIINPNIDMNNCSTAIKVMSSKILQNEETETKKNNLISDTNELLDEVLTFDENELKNNNLVFDSKYASIMSLPVPPAKSIYVKPNKPIKYEEIKPLNILNSTYRCLH